MASQTPVSRKFIVDPFAEFGLTTSAERATFDVLWQQFERHAPLFGCADHPDVDPEQIDAVRRTVHRQLAQFARDGAIRAVEHHAVRTFASALRGSGGLPRVAVDPALVPAIDAAITRICASANCRYVPLHELLGHHQSLLRHYGIHVGAFVELVDWTIAMIEAPEASDVATRLIMALRRLSPVSMPSEPVKLAMAELHLEPDDRELPASVRSCPLALARFASEAAPGHDAEFGAGYPLSQRWSMMLTTELRAAEIGAPKQLPELLDNALLVHLLGLEDRARKAVLADAADRILVHGMIPLAREVGAKQSRHEPVAVYLVNVVGRALRPWSFAAPPLSFEHREVLLAMLCELATAKARKLLHQEKRHADRHEHPALIRRAVNRALDRLPGRVNAISPRQRIDRIAAGFRYMNRARRGTDPRARDLAIVAEFVGEGPRF